MPISRGEKWFGVLNYALLVFLAAVCLIPLLNVLAISFSSSHAVAAGKVTLFPVDFTLASYENVFGQRQMRQSFVISVERVLLGVAVNMLLTILTAYSLSRDPSKFPFRTFYVWFFVVTMLFGGGLIPTYMVVSETRLLGTLWALVIPSAVPVFNVVLLLNFFRNLPKELDEAAKVDGAGHWTTLWRIYVPLSLPALATLTLFSAVGHWNSWFDGLIYMNSPERYPLQSFLQTVVIKLDLTRMTAKDVELLTEISDRTNKAAQIFVAIFPILLVYPFLQKYFVKGVVVGSVKE